MTHALEPAANPTLAGPFDSLRDYAKALESAGRLLRIDEMDQDMFEATGFAYRLIDEYGYDEAPAFLIQRVRSGGKWLQGPVLGNIFGGWTGEALALGIKVPQDTQRAAFRATFAHLQSLLDSSGKWPRISPHQVASSAAPCKANIQLGDDVDIEQFAWLHTNPGDAGRYISAASVFIEDPELGRNVGTYRCQVKGPRRIGVNPEIGQHAWNLLMRARQRGRKTVPAAVVMGTDPLTFALSTSKMAGFGEDELDIAGGLRGRPVEIVQCETSGIRVPAHAEIVLEGEIPVTETEAEGPYAETYGYLGREKPENFFMNVHAVTHRDTPWISNSFSGITKLTMGIPQLVQNDFKYRQVIPNLVEFFRPTETTGVVIASINKRLPGDGMLAGQHIAANDIFGKMVIIVDGDVDIHSRSQLMHALGTRWQPSASLVIPQTRGMPLDPSQSERWLTSKIIIDATRQLPAEGGPDEWPAISRELLRQQSPATFELVARRWPEYFRR